MRTKLFNTFIIFSFSVMFILIILNKTLIFDTISFSLHLFVNSLIPVMFPFFVISEILIEYQITNYIPKCIKKIFRTLFNTSDIGVSIFFLSLFSGFPSNARNTVSFYERNCISALEGGQILTFTHFANPLFVISTIGLMFLHNERYGYIILVSHYIGNIIIGILFRNSTTINNYSIKESKCQSFSKVFIKSIRRAIDTLLLVLGTLTSFLILSALIIETFNLSLYTSAIIKGILEMTMGLKAISSLFISDIYKVVISTMFISFGGLAVHMQVISQIVDSEIKYLPFFMARIMHSLISGIICYVLYIIIF